MKFESEIECKQVEIILEGLKKVKLGDITMPEALAIIKAADFLQRQVQIAKAPQPQGVVSSDPLDIGKKITPIGPGKKK